MNNLIEFLFGAKFSITIYNMNPHITKTDSKIISISKLSYPRLLFYINHCQKHNNDFRVSISGKDKTKTYHDGAFFLEVKNGIVQKSLSDSDLIIKYLNKVNSLF